MKRLAILFLVTLSQSVHAEKLTIYAASSMTNAIDALAVEYEKVHDVDVIKVFGGSASIARQIYRGAPADVYISANAKWVDYLLEQGVASSDDTHVIAKNQLVVVANTAQQKSSPLMVSSFESWQKSLGSGRLAIGIPESVPVGAYAQQALTSQGVWQKLKTKTAPLSNVRQVLAMVERGETPLGIVYKTDALLSSDVNVVARFGDDTHDPIVYPLVNVTKTKQAESFVEFILSRSGQTILQSYGFDSANDDRE
ncbi:molybdate ABC transporter substrate-binding protein [Vibrio sp. 10N.286.49.C2]|uniref:molybdate ABC transporter substrate-binding protein n=1 Tax=unclassified Vibrio TaxID=2614977 RepID=UPI000C865DD8|nr:MULTISPECIES: molybdate ABC transporter substrate-binding protein [unclassified Vibrio]PMH38289.1 molybdate ABC transporter substrate-binding protein [Vibrio sp. 10N.286.49.C2]PMH55697.1 molybdate ABC transporter substrate-binding protein [Vibrio sp. 10N.286.49.B1]PMH79275.1 molybdate ABC transporter substrate-binding protein [Vibrio sp. 10N.286.48.B7]